MLVSCFSFTRACLNLKLSSGFLMFRVSHDEVSNVRSHRVFLQHPKDILISYMNSKWQLNYEFSMHLIYLFVNLISLSEHQPQIEKYKNYNIIPETDITCLSAYHHWVKMISTFWFSKSLINGYRSILYTYWLFHYRVVSIQFRNFH